MLPAKLNILGIDVSRVDYGIVIEEIISAAKERKSFGVTAIAVHGIMEGFLDHKFAEQLNEFHIVTPDGQPVRWAMNLLGATELKDRVYGPTLMLKVCEKAALEKLPLFLYGSKENVLKKLSQNLSKKYPDLIIAGMQSDRFREATLEEDEKDINLINSSGTKIIFVGRGCPRQERWVANHLGKINAAMIAVGAAFDFHAGTLRKAPKLLQDWGLEWLFRLLMEPIRLWKRYLLLNPLFILNFSLQLMRVRKFKK
jgi:exopolysaccharide biosynthesis WecB/TagA/CpsF family protein